MRLVALISAILLSGCSKVIIIQDNAAQTDPEEGEFIMEMIPMIPPSAPRINIPSVPHPNDSEWYYEA